MHDRPAAAADRDRVAGQSDRDCVSAAKSGGQSGRSAVVPARITGRERAPGASLGIVFLPVEQQHVIAQQDQRVTAEGAWLTYTRIGLDTFPAANGPCSAPPSLAGCRACTSGLNLIWETYTHFTVDPGGEVRPVIGGEIAAPGA